MSRAFNLIDEKWIPVRLPDGSRDELGIRATLLQAKDITAIEDPSPLVVASLHRFLLALLYRVLEGPTDIEQAKVLFRTGLPTEKIEIYLEKWRDRFWLFDDKYPFGQVPSVPDEEIEPWTKLTAEFNARTNKVLFDHTDIINLPEASTNMLARWIVTTQNFSVRGGRGYRPSPSSEGVMCIPVGEYLEQTLLLSLIPYPNRLVMSNDSALWEREALEYRQFKAGMERPATGYADLYTWQARAMRLIERGNSACKDVAFIPGIGYMDSGLRDPLSPYRKKSTDKIRIVGWKETGLWRDFSSLVPDSLSNSDQLAPQVINHIVALSRYRLIGNSIPVLTIGQKYDNASIDFWRMELFLMPLEIISIKYFKEEIKKLLQYAEDASEALENALRETGKAIITKGTRKLIEDKWAKGKLKPGDVTRFITSTNVLLLYWLPLEAKFHNILQSYTQDENPDEIELDWLISIRSAFMAAWDQYRASISSVDAWVIRAFVLAEKPITKKRKELDCKIAECKTSLKKEGA